MEWRDIQRVTETECVWSIEADIFHLRCWLIEVFPDRFSHIAQPLFDLTKANSAFKWTTEEKSAFDTLQDRITSAPILTLPDNSRPYRVEADSLDFATRAVLF